MIYTSALLSSGKLWHFGLQWLEGPPSTQIHASCECVSVRNVHMFFFSLLSAYLHMNFFVFILSLFFFKHSFIVITNA